MVWHCKNRNYDNGRIARLLMAHQAIVNDFIPPLIENDHRREYLDALADAVELERFLEKSIDKSLELIFKSYRGNRIEIEKWLEAHAVVSFE